MITVLCNLLDIGHSEIIHCWPDSKESLEQAEEFADRMQLADHGTDCVYYVRENYGYDLPVGSSCK